MARLPRVVVVDVPHHVTQRGNAQQEILSTDADRSTYLELVRQYSELYSLDLLGYCLMSNHVHLIAVPYTPDALSHSLKHAHGRYAAYWNALHSSTGHVWQGRFYSCPLDESHLWTALRYVELNPVRAGIVKTPTHWQWSSAAAHCGIVSPIAMLHLERWRRRWTFSEWRQFLHNAESDAEVRALRHCTYTGRPLGNAEFIVQLEKRMLRPLMPRKGGRPQKRSAHSGQPEVISVA
jgi:putative transposase